MVRLLSDIGCHRPTRQQQRHQVLTASVFEPEPPRTATFMVDSESTFVLAEAESQNHLFLRGLYINVQQKRKSLLLCKQF